MKIQPHAAITLAFCSATILADDGVLYHNGSPRLMHGESTIRMVQEDIRAYVYRDHANVTCRFIFHNDGPPVDARIGFPDDDADHEGGPIEPAIKRFASKVDGKWVPTQIELASDRKDRADLYHVKTVHFASRQTRIIDDGYRTELSGGGTRNLVSNRAGGIENLYLSQFNYTMSSGASWKGTIGLATVTIVFLEKHLRHLRGVDESEFGDPLSDEGRHLERVPKNRVIWAGFTKPIISGNQIVFRRRNFKPTERDNISLSFDWARFTETHWGQ